MHRNMTGQQNNKKTVTSLPLIFVINTCKVKYVVMYGCFQEMQIFSKLSSGIND